MELPPSVQELVDSQECREVMAIALDARGDPRLSAWEEGFLINMAEAARVCRPLSAKQRAVLEQIAAKVAAPPGLAADEGADEPVDHMGL